MHQLIFKYIEKTIKPDEKEELNSLIQSDEQIKEEFAYAQNIYALSALLESEDDEQIGRAQLSKFKKRHQKNRYLPFLKNIMKYAAVVLLTIVSTWLFLKDQQRISESLVAYEEYKTPSGQRAKVVLHDGTTVWLNAASTLRYPNIFMGKTRKVELDGEAFFDVKHDEDHPFVVSTEKLDIKVLGTRFNVFSYKGSDGFNAYLEEGSIRIYKSSDEGNALQLNPNEIAELSNNRLIKRAADKKDFLLWRDGIYAFDDIAFKEIIKKLELYYDITIEIDNPALAEYKFNGKFRQRDGIVSALRTFQKAYPFSFYKDDDLNHITIK
ncbi:FecR family protein [Massilibacteroides vaginae]|uniref:FecR family protein n=1 Tax=Massilibacteroides vaginae TaxID=1673718 RepID=UPI000A1C95CF|nr:FecR domain-containing protein [Massilibacteroides vaginae]